MPVLVAPGSDVALGNTTEVGSAVGWGDGVWVTVDVAVASCWATAFAGTVGPGCNCPGNVPNSPFRKKMFKTNIDPKVTHNNAIRIGIG